MLKQGVLPVNSVWCWTYFLSQTFPEFQNFVTTECITVLFGTSFSGYTLLYASWTAAIILMPRIVHILLMKVLCLHLHSFCATGLSSSLATWVPCTWVLWRRIGESITLGWTCFWFQFLPQLWLLLGCVLSGISSVTYFFISKSSLHCDQASYFLKYISRNWMSESYIFYVFHKRIKN